MLYKRGKIWYVRFSYRGEHVNVSARTTSRKAAEQVEAKLRSDLWNRAELGVEQRTWDEAVITWLETKKHKRSLADDLRKLVWLEEHWGGSQLAQITASVIETTLAKRDVSNATRNRYRAVIMAVLRNAQRLGWLAKLPDVPKLPERKSTPKFLTHEQARELLQALDTPRRKHLHDMVALSLATGLRESNITGLKWSQVDLERRQIVVEATKSKSGSAMRIPLNNAAMAILRGRSQNGNDDTQSENRISGKVINYVFTYRGKPVKKANRDGFQQALSECGLDIRWHDLRHTWASWHVMAGTPLRVLQELGGWADLSMVMRYAHLAPAHIDSFAENATIDCARSGEAVTARNDENAASD